VLLARILSHSATTAHRRIEPLMATPLRPATSPSGTRVLAVASLLLALLPLAACTYDPPVAGDRTSPKYQTDLKACRDKAAHDVYMNFAGSIGTWIISPITAPSARRRAVRACLLSRGYTLQAS
jgi:hypothetical protein